MDEICFSCNLKFVWINGNATCKIDAKIDLLQKYITDLN